MKRYYKVLLIIAVVFVLLLAYQLLAFFGNPIIKLKVTKNCGKRIVTDFVDLDLEKDKALYNFKDNTYIVNVKDPKSIDTHFNYIYDNKGLFIDTTYDYAVRDKMNTEIRANHEYGDRFDEMIKDDDSATDHSFAFLELDIDMVDGFERDQKFNLYELGIQYGHVYVTKNIDILNEDSLMHEVKSFK